jgi:hypothetical protein
VELDRRENEDRIGESQPLRERTLSVWDKNCRGWESNPRQSGYKADALPSKLALDWLMAKYFSKLSNQLTMNFSLHFQKCASHLGVKTAAEADSQYRAVCRALVTEALELSMFLDVVQAQGTTELRGNTLALASSYDLDQLKNSDWVSVTFMLAIEAGIQNQYPFLCLDSDQTFLTINGLVHSDLRKVFFL